MDREAAVKHGVLEHMLRDASAEPTDLPLSLLKYITDNFSDDRQIGWGGFSVVYQGMIGIRAVAIKKLKESLHILEKKFNEEVGCLLKTKHKNVVRFLGYCSDTRGIVVDYERKFVMADVRQRLLCFEYLPNGSLDKYITGASCVLGWRKLYKIIKGICKGLHYLHVKRRIVHLDLKPANILLDDNMLPKITDFGLSRCFDEKQSQVFTSHVNGTPGYMAPEYFEGEITFSSDIYSLGVIIREIVTIEKRSRDVENVLDIWGKRFPQSQEDIQLEQIRICTEIGIECTEHNPAKRPDIQNIIDRLDGTVEKDSMVLHRYALNTVRGETSSESWSVTKPRRRTVQDYEIGRHGDKDKVSSKPGPMEKIKKVFSAMGLVRSPNVPNNCERTETSNSTILVLYGKSSEDKDLLAAAATSLSLNDGERLLSLTLNIGGADEGFDAGAYLGELHARRFGSRILWSPRISSTHDLVSQNFDKLPMGVVCVADTQFKGRGRSRNVWQSPPGCLMFSFTLQMNDPYKLPFIQYVVCIAMIEAINELFCANGLAELDVKIKWPNDIYLKGLKVGGALCTSSYETKVYNVCIGIGLNVDNKNPTTCLNAVIQKLKANSPRLKREDILASFFNKFEVIFDILSQEGFPALEQRYYSAWLHSGQIVLVQDVYEGQTVESVVTIQGLTPSAYLYGIGEDGKKYELEPDGNSFDFFTGLVKKKMEE